MMATITHAYVAVGFAGVTAFILLLLCGDQRVLDNGDLGGTEVTMQSAPRSCCPCR
jgi:hypothetical protein